MILKDNFHFFCLNISKCSKYLNIGYKVWKISKKENYWYLPYLWISINISLVIEKSYSCLLNHFKIILTINNKILRSTLIWFWLHVKGNQDDKTGTLDIWNTLNVDRNKGENKELILEKNQALTTKGLIISKMWIGVSLQNYHKPISKKKHFTRRQSIHQYSGHNRIFHLKPSPSILIE